MLCGSCSGVSSLERRLKLIGNFKVTTSTTINNVKKQLIYEQNNCSARASGFLVHFFDVHCTTTT